MSVLLFVKHEVKEYIFTNEPECLCINQARFYRYDIFPLLTIPVSGITRFSRNIITNCKTCKICIKSKSKFNIRIPRQYHISFSYSARPQKVHNTETNTKIYTSFIKFMPFCKYLKWGARTGASQSRQSSRFRLR